MEYFPRIHISGASGSGKSTLGEKLQKIYGNKIFVVDTDSFFQPYNENGKLLLKKRKELNKEEYIEFYKDLFVKEIENVSKKYKDKIVVYVGLLDNMSYYGVFAEWNFDYKLYLDVPMNILLKRYYNRLSEFDDSYWDKVETGDRNVESSEELIRESKISKKDHISMGYKMLDYNNLIEKVKKIIDSDKNEEIDINSSFIKSIFTSSETKERKRRIVLLQKYLEPIVKNFHDVIRYFPSLAQNLKNYYNVSFESTEFVGDNMILYTGLLDFVEQERIQFSMNKFNEKEIFNQLVEKIKFSLNSTNQKNNFNFSNNTVLIGFSKTVSIFLNSMAYNVKKKMYGAEYFELKTNSNPGYILKYDTNPLASVILSSNQISYSNENLEMLAEKIYSNYLLEKE